MANDDTNFSVHVPHSHTLQHLMTMKYVEWLSNILEGMAKTYGGSLGTWWNIFWNYPPVKILRPPYNNWRPPVITWNPPHNNLWPLVINWRPPHNNWWLRVIMWRPPYNNWWPLVIIWRPPVINWRPPHNNRRPLVIINWRPPHDNWWPRFINWWPPYDNWWPPVVIWWPRDNNGMMISKNISPMSQGSHRKYYIPLQWRHNGRNSVSNH